jgi:myo-inositol-1(or 4)-monophosphatase
MPSPSPDAPEISAPFAEAVERIVREAAEREILPRYRSVTAYRKHDGSLLTEADLAAQRALVAGLSVLIDYPVLGEEMPGEEQLRVWEGGGRFWCIDPIDGTSNFSNGIPYFAVSVALMEHDRPLLGCIYDPIAEESFYAARGAGAWLNGRKLRRQVGSRTLAGSLAEIDLRKEKSPLRAAIRDSSPYARRKTSGSSALSWCHLAAGRVDLVLHAGQMVWDYSAGALILAEAGGRLATLDSDDFWSGPVWQRSVIATHDAALFDPWSRWVRGHHAERTAQ